MSVNIQEHMTQVTWLMLHDSCNMSYIKLLLDSYNTPVPELISFHLFIVNWVKIVQNYSQYSNDPTSIKVFDVFDFVFSDFWRHRIHVHQWYSVIWNKMTIIKIIKFRKLNETESFIMSHIINDVINDCQMVRLLNDSQIVIVEVLLSRL